MGTIAIGDTKTGATKSSSKFLLEVRFLLPERGRTGPPPSLAAEASSTTKTNATRTLRVRSERVVGDVFGATR
jgi:hypothetical protein